jgi:hypothetical protein
LWSKIARCATLLGLAGCLAGATGCFSGGVYTHVTKPLDVNLDRTPVHDGGRAGITTIHYADLETLSVLGIWTQRWAVVYGE